MGHHAHAYLAYGYDLGPVPNFLGLDESAEPAWAEDGFAVDAVRRLFDYFCLAGAEDTRPNSFDYAKAVQNKAGLAIVSYGSQDEPSFVLATSWFAAGFNEPSTVSPVMTDAERRRADRRLADAASALGLDLGHATPRWTLAVGHITPRWALAADYD